MKTLLINWGLDGYTGWGWNGANLARYASLNGWQVFGRIDWSGLPPEWKLEGWEVHPPDGKTFDAAIFPAGNRHVAPIPTECAKRCAVETFFEDPAITSQSVAAYGQADVVIVGSEWNRKLLESAGVKNVVLVHQGADAYGVAPPPKPTIVWEGNPMPASPPRRIFSGGKLEYRKGQDIVVAAFREYLKEDPSAILVTAWQHRFPWALEGLTKAGHVKTAPVMTEQGIDVLGWLEREGVPRANAVDVGRVPSYALQWVMALCDVAVFPNRCEGGTNLVAMECLRVGVPTLATINSGQMELGRWGAVPLGVECPPVALCAAVKNVEACFSTGTRLAIPSWADHARAVLSHLGG